MKNEEVFWEEEKAQKCTKLWADHIPNYTINFDDWREKVQKWALIPLNERKTHIFMKNAKKIIDEKDKFITKVLPYLCSYLPEDVDLSAAIHFAAFIPARAFAMEELVVSISAPYWNNNPNNILNALIHEIFHVGYDNCRDLRIEKKLKNDLLYKMLINFHEEGICTYVGYKALPIFPAPDEKDYRLFDNNFDIKRLLTDLNSVFSKFDNLSDEEIEKLAWEKCITGIAYYVVGTYMCKIIEEKQGKYALINTLIKGPLFFINFYNKLVDDEMKVRINDLVEK